MTTTAHHHYHQQNSQNDSQSTDADLSALWNTYKLAMAKALAGFEANKPSSERPFKRAAQAAACEEALRGRVGTKLGRNEVLSYHGTYFMVRRSDCGHTFSESVGSEAYDRKACPVCRSEKGKAERLARNNGTTEQL